MNGGESKLSTNLTVFMKMQFLLVFLFYGALSVGIHWQVNMIQPEPYMDEIFHVPQCQKYCSGMYSEVGHKLASI